MKLTLFVVLLSVVQLLANSGYSQNTRFTLAKENTTIEDVLGILEKSSDFYFLYNGKLVDVTQKVTISVENELLENTLNELFRNTNITYKIFERQVVLSPSDAFGNSQQQKKTISGKVTDSSGATLPGVSVVVKGTTNGVITDMDGNYALINIPENAILQFSFVGMKMQEIAIGTKTTINLTLEEETVGIEEVVAIGYGTMKKSDLTGAVGSVKGSVLTERKSLQTSEALQGTIAGVMVSRSDGKPNSSANIRIRGITTIGDSTPLVIVDGVPGMSIDDVNPNDIESISVLKDGASASIYGSRAASGVILITTKRAQDGISEFNYDFVYGFSKPTELPEYTGSVRYMQMMNELTWNDTGNNANEYPTFSKDLIGNYPTLHTQNPDLYPDTDWQDIIFKDNISRQSHLFGFKVGTKNIRTIGSFNYEKVGVLYDLDDAAYKRYTARVNNDIVINKILSANIDIFYKNDNNYQSSYDPIAQAKIMPSIYAAEYSDGRVASGKASENPYGLFKYGGFNDVIQNKLGAKASIDFKPFKDLKLSIVFSPNLATYKQKLFKIAVPAYYLNDPTTIESYLYGRTSTSLSEARNESYNITKQFLINYTKDIVGGHNVNFLAGYEDYYSKYETISASRDQYDLTDYPYLSIGNSNFQYNNGSAYEYAYRSYFGRLLYNYKNKYFAQANIRYDGSSRFYKDYRWGTFPSFSLGWVVTEEPFLNSNSTLSFLKLRGSWGTLGNERIGSYYPYQSTIAFGNMLLYQSGVATAQKTAYQPQYNIQDISWETTESWDIGLDANLFNNRLQFSGDYYQKKTKKMLMQLEIPDYMGVANPDQNAGNMYTKGWEAQIGWSDKVGGLKYSISAHMSDFKSKMGDLGGIEFLGSQVKKQGSEFNEWFGYKSDGLFLTQEDVINSPKMNAVVGIGDIKYVDISGPNGVPDGKISADYDRVLLGGSLPRNMFGGKINLAYRNFDFSVTVQGNGKQNVILLNQPLNGAWQNSESFIDGNYWSKYNTDEQNSSVKYPKLSSRTGGLNYTTSDYWMINGAYLRLKNVTLGYTVPKSALDLIKLHELRFFVSATDLFSLDKFPRGLDAETISSSYYPITSTFLLGASIKF